MIHGKLWGLEDGNVVLPLHSLYHVLVDLGLFLNAHSAQVPLTERMLTTKSSDRIIRFAVSPGLMGCHFVTSRANCNQILSSVSLQKDLISPFQVEPKVFS